MEVDNVENDADDILKSDNFFSDEMSDFGGGWGNETQIIPNNSEQSSPEVQGNPVQTHNQSVPPNNIRFRGNNRFMGGGRGRGGREANNDSIRFEGNWKQQGSFPQTQIMSGPPPNLQHHSPFNPVQNLWVETKTEDSKSYYYHASTRETTWTRPEGPNVNIMKQNVFEQLSKKQMRPTENQEPELGDPSKIGMMPPNLAMDTSHMPPQHSNPFPFMGSNIPPQFNNMPPFGMPPPWNSQQPTQWQVPQPNKVMFDKKIDPQILAKAAEWSEHRAPDGRSYYYRASRGESVWERPQPLKDLDDARMVASHSQPPPGINQLGSSVMTQGNLQLDSLDMSNKLLIGETEAEKVRKKRESEKRKLEEDVAVDKIKQQPAKPLDKSRPVSSTPIQGTPWCVVWTGDSRVFFYNPSTRTSVWDRPEDLVGRADVDKAVTQIPEQLRGNAEDIIGEKSNGTTVEVVCAESGKKESGISSGTEKNTTNEESSEDGDDNVPSKKLKTDESVTPTKIPQLVTPVEKRIDLVKDGAMEAEVRAAKERAMVPLDVRVKSFKEMLKEKEVSAFSTWEKELHKIVFDPRYLLLASKERKQVFEKYLKDEAEDERRQKRNKLKQKRDEFRALLDHANLHGKSSFSDFCSRYKNDERYKSIEKMRDRENLFNDYLMELRKKEKDEKQNKKEQIRKEFFAMLREHTEIDRHSHWMDVKKKIDQDARYKAVGESILREDYFYDFLKVLKDERKKTKENKKSSKEKKSKKSSKEKKSSREKGKSSDNNETTNSKKSDDDNCNIIKDDTKKNEEVEDSGKSDSEKDQEDGEHSGVSSDVEDTVRQRKERDRQIRAEASIKERGKEVQRTLEGHLRDRDKERQHHKKDEAVRHFTALLADLVRNADLTWKEVKKQLKKDHRYELVENLERDEREKLFNDHINLLSKKKRDKFREMLEEISGLELTSSWKEIKRQIKEDPRYLKFGSSERCEREFREYVKDKTSAARSAFKELLQECKLLNHKSFDLYTENNNHLKEIEDILKNDKRFLILDHIASERTQIVLSYLDDLKKRGPPPPPTATESIRRK